MAIVSKILDSKQLKVWDKIKNLKDIGVLAGGTGLALQLGHRLSVDFDFFYPKEINNHFILQVRKNFGRIRILINNSDELTFLTPEDVKITFLYYPFKVSHKPIIIDDIKVMDIKDIASAKAYTLNRRASVKDYIDLYFITKNKFSLEEIVKNAQLVYGDLFSEKLFLSQLLYTEDIDKKEMENIIFLTNGKITINMIKKYFEKMIKI